MSSTENEKSSRKRHSRFKSVISFGSKEDPPGITPLPPDDSASTSTSQSRISSQKDKKSGFFGVNRLVAPTLSVSKLDFFRSHKNTSSVSLGGSAATASISSTTGIVSASTTSTSQTTPCTTISSLLVNTTIQTTAASTPSPTGTTSPIPTNATATGINPPNNTIDPVPSVPATPTTPTTSLSPITTPIVANGNPLPPDLWAEAIKKLPEEDQKLLELSNPNNDPWKDVVNDLTKQTENLRDSKRSEVWKIEWGGRTIILREIAEKTISWLKKFKEVGDIAVQYDPGHAALPWAAVRFVLQALIADSEARYAVFIGIERVVWIIGRYAAYEKIYIGLGIEHEKPLKERIIGLYFSLLGFLIKSKRFLETPTLKRAVGAVTSNDYSENLKALQEMEAEAMKDLEVVRDQRFDLYHDLNTKSLETLQNFLDQLDKPISRIDRSVERIIDNLDKTERGAALAWASPLNHNHQHDFAVDTITPGTCTWLHKNREFLDWRNSNSSAIFWLKGDPGSGKTRLTASVVQLLLDERKNAKGHDCIAYFYCDGKTGDKTRTEPQSIVGSLLKQMATLDPSQSIQSPIAKEYRRRKESGNIGSSPSFKEAKNLIFDIARAQLYPSINIVIDALDECQTDTREDLVKMLIELVLNSNCLAKVFLSSRLHETDLNIRLESVPKHYIKLEETSGDVELFIDTKMQEYLSENRFLPRRPPLEREKLAARAVGLLKAKCRGMFLWADLQMKELCKLRTASEVDMCLSTLPKNLNSTYENILEQIEQDGGQAVLIASTAFHWILGTFRSLSPGELLGAIQEKTNDEDLTLASVLETCRNILVLDQEEETVRFVHLSAVEFLRHSERKGFPELHFSSQDSVISVTSDCLAFFEAEDQRCTSFDPTQLCFYWLQSPHIKKYVDMLEFVPEQRTESNFGSSSKAPPLRGNEVRPFLRYSIFVWEQWVIQLRQCSDISGNFRERVKMFLGTHLEPSRALQQLLEYGILISREVADLGLDNGEPTESVEKKLQLPLEVIYFSYNRFRSKEVWNGFGFFSAYQSFQTKEGVPSPLFLATCIGIGWYIEWLDTIEGPLDQYKSRNDLDLLSLCASSLDIARDYIVEHIIVCRETFTIVTNLPGFTATEPGTNGFLYLALNQLENYRHNGNDLLIRDWVFYLSTIIQKYSVFNIDPFQIARWGLYCTLYMISSTEIGLAMMGDVFATLSNISLYPCKGVLKSDASGEENRQALKSWLIYSRAAPDSGILAQDRKFSLCNSLPVCPLSVINIFMLSTDGYDSKLPLSTYMEFWLKRGANPNEIGFWGTLGHLIVAAFLRDSDALGVENILFLMEKKELTKCLELLVSYGGDLNLRHERTKETVFEYACRFGVDDKVEHINENEADSDSDSEIGSSEILRILRKEAEIRRKEVVEVLLALDISVTKYSLLNLYRSDDSKTSEVLLASGHKVDEEAEALLGEFREALKLTSSKTALELLESGLNPRMIYSKVEDFKKALRDIPTVEIIAEDELDELWNSGDSKPRWDEIFSSSWLSSCDLGLDTNLKLEYPYEDWTKIEQGILTPFALIDKVFREIKSGYKSELNIED